MIDKIFAKLNDSQKEAVKQFEGPVLILAGAGSGKTTTIVSRLAYIIDELGIPPSNTLTLTFTNKAANEMRERALSLISSEAHPPLLCTFHKFGLIFLKFNMHLLGRKNSFVVIDSDDKKRIIKRLDPELQTSLVASEISRYKNSLMSPDEAYKAAEFFNYQQIAKVYGEYESYLRDNNLVDFDDLLSLTYKILDEHPQIAKDLSSKYQYIMVDEYQDTNELQLKLLHKLCATHKNICVVGDDDQSIYGWRGAHIRNILEFDQDFSDAKVFKLEHNYRSREPILKVANALIAHNRSRLGKELISTRGSGEDVALLHSSDENEEARKIAAKVAKLLSSGVNSSQIAILYRVNVLSRSIEEGLNRAKISYRLVGGLRFYDRAEVKDIISYLRVIANEHDDFSFKRIINKPKRGLGKATIDKLEDAATKVNSSLFGYIYNSSDKVLDDLVKMKNTKTLKKLVADVKQMQQIATNTTYSIVDELENIFKIKDIYRATQEEFERFLNIDEFYALFKDYIKNNPTATLDEFLNETTLLSDQDEIDGDSIYMMSIHASKGLEFEHIFIIGLEEGFLPLIGDGSDVEEERRLAYVAFTRAKESLTLSHVDSRFYKGKRSDLLKSRFFSEAGLSEGSLVVEKSSAFKKGDLVRHKIFGTGRVNGVSKAGREFKLEINFAGIKREIMASFVEKL